MSAVPFNVFTASLEGVSLIEASAGTGKTWNICGLYLRLLLERKLEAQKILVVTFTNAATAELRERIRTRIVEALECLRGRTPGGDRFVPELIDAVKKNSGRTDREMQSSLEAALSCFDEAAIYTIHGFCQRALADTPLAAGLPYGLELIEDDAELRQQAAADFWRREVASRQGDPDLAAWLAVRYESPTVWAKLLQLLQAKPLSRLIWPDAIDEPVRPLHQPLHEAFGVAKALWERERKNAVAAIAAEVDKSLHRNVYTLDAVEEGAFAWDAWFSSGDPMSPLIRKEKARRAALFSAATLIEKTRRGCTTPKHAFFGAAEAVVDLRAQMEEQLQRLRLQLLRKMAQETVPQLREQKRARRVIGFDDILYNAWDALCNGRRPWLAAALRSRYPAALIDEFQDTDPLQCAIFMEIYDQPGATGPLFLVGDPKQAIYSFRNADLHTYLQASRRARTTGTLLSNQRSVEGLIKATNALFTANPGGFMLQGIGYQAVALGSKKRPPFADRSEKSQSALRIWRLPCDGEGRYPLRDDAHELAVKATAAEISRLLRESSAGRITLEDRALRGGDIAVLVRTHRQGRWIKEALSALGIGAVELSPESIFATRDAEDLARVLHCILEPAQRPLLLAALATELIGKTAAEVEAISADDAGLAEWTSRFDALRATWLSRGFGVMFRQWIDQDGVSRRLLARADGERRMTNLLHLGELLHEASQQQPAPDGLLRWLASQRSTAAAGEETQVRLESDRNLVQIVTIHKAKGLEYPIVFCPFAWDGFMQLRNEQRGIEYHDESDSAVIDFRPDAAAQDDVDFQRRQEMVAERVRLTYVALTRAIHRCYLIAGCYGHRTKDGQSVKPSAKSVLNWLASKTRHPYEQWAEQKRTAQDIEQSWTQIAEQGAPHILLTDLPQGRGTSVSDSRQQRQGLAALSPPKHIDPGWRIGSFTALATGAVHEAAASDHDARVVQVDSAPPADLAGHDILRFPRGPSAGHCMHAMLERADFTDASSWDGAIQRALALHPQRGPDASLAAPALHRRMLRAMLEDIVATPLPGGIVLGQVALNRRLNELAFHLPAANLSAARLNAWLASNRYPTPRLGFDALRGYLHGFIDLMFESGGRYYVLDWKSNHLGYAREDYGAEPVAGAMLEHGYHLQATLYSIAVHRYLARRVAGYDYERHFGGALYLFVRGVRPKWLDAKGAPLGVWFHKPAAKALDSLDALIAGKTSKAAA